MTALGFTTAGALLALWLSTTEETDGWLKRWLYRKLSGREVNGMEVA